MRSRGKFRGFRLAHYSEFGLLVSAIGGRNGWLGAEWPIIIAIALSRSYILTSPLNATPHSLYAGAGIGLGDAALAPSGDGRWAPITSEGSHRSFPFQSV
jgi:hypothetical protein